MTDDKQGGQPQKTVAELLAQHGAKPEGGRRRRRRAAEDDEVPESPRGLEPGGVSDTGAQAIIDRVTGDGGTPPPPSRPARRPRPQGPGTTGQAPLPRQQDSQPMPQPGASAPTRQTQPVRPPQESGQYPRPPQESGQFGRPPQESGQYPRPPQQSGQFPRPPQESSQFVRPLESNGLQRPLDSNGLQVPPRGRPPRPQPPGSAEETRGQVPPVRRRPEASAVPPGTLSARLDGVAEGEADEQSGPMAGGAFSSPVQPARRRRMPGLPDRSKPEPSTEQFSAVHEEEPEPPAKAPPAKVSPPPKDAAPTGLAGWRKRRKKRQTEDTEIGVMPAVPFEPEAEPEPEPFGEPDPFDGGPPTMGHPAPMPFVPPHSFDDRERDRPDNLDDYEHEFAEPAYPDGPDFGRDDYGFGRNAAGLRAGRGPGGVDYEDDFEDDRGEDVVDDEPEEYVEDAASPGKQWLGLGAQLAFGVMGGAAVWLGFNWLWVNIPAAALVAALLVIVALVWIVRKIRKAEDLQTTVLALLVGLVVTVSPAALLLVSR